MSLLRRRARQAVRRGALLGMRTWYQATGQSTLAAREPGVTVLLLHNTLPRELKGLVRFVDANRDDLMGFADAMIALKTAKVDRPMVALTFDDGFRSNMRAAEELSRRGLDACFYVPTDIVGLGRLETDAFFRRPQAEGVMTWADLEALRAYGHTVGSHCKQHLSLAELPAAEAEDQVKGSVEVLRQRLGAADHFAWPFGSLAHAPVDDVVRWCADVGVLPASGVRGRNTVDRFAWQRYLSRDAVDLNWLGTDVDVFTTRAFRKHR